MAATVSSKVSCCRPELSSPSSISSIALTTITHLHLHNKIWRVNVEVERGDRKRKKYGARQRSFLQEDKKSHTHIGIKDTYRNLKNLFFFIILFHKYTHTYKNSVCQRLAVLDYLRTHCLPLLQRSLSIKVADKLIIPQGHLLGAVWQQSDSIANRYCINWLSWPILTLSKYIEIKIKAQNMVNQNRTRFNHV